MNPLLLSLAITILPDPTHDPLTGGQITTHTNPPVIPRIARVHTIETPAIVYHRDIPMITTILRPTVTYADGLWIITFKKDETK